MIIGRLYWKLRDKKIVFIILLCMTIVLYFHNFYSTHYLSAVPGYKSKCNFEFARHLIENMCSLRNENQDSIIGNMCSDLCNRKNSYEYYKEYRLSDCHARSHNINQNSIDESKTVLIYELNNRQKETDTKPLKLVLKSMKQYYLDFDTHLDFDFKEKSVFNQLNYLQTYIESTLKTKLGIKIDKSIYEKWIKVYENDAKRAVEDLKTQVYSKNQKDFNYYIRTFDPDNFDFYLEALLNGDRQKLASYIQNLIILVSQDDYLFYRFYHSKPGSMKIYGSCGHFYLVEYAEPLTYKVRLMDVSERKKLALQFLELVYNLDKSYLIIMEDSKLQAEPVQMCDVKLDNFGLNQNGELKIIDTDMVSPDTYLFSSRVCNQHDDCHFFDCKSYCDPDTKRCLNKRVNNNLQTVCDKIFDNSLNKKDGILSGVSFGSNVQSEIINNLDKCKYPRGFNKSKVPSKSSHRIIRAFMVLLKDTGIKINR